MTDFFKNLDAQLLQKLQNTEEFINNTTTNSQSTEKEATTPLQEVVEVEPSSKKHKLDKLHKFETPNLAISQVKLANKEMRALLAQNKLESSTFLESQQKSVGEYLLDRWKSTISK